MPISELIEFVLGYRQRNQSASKEQIAGAAAHALHLTKHRSPTWSSPCLLYGLSTVCHSQSLLSDLTQPTFCWRTPRS